jgi:hypothetical protein
MRRRVGAASVALLLFLAAPPSTPPLVLAGEPGQSPSSETGPLPRAAAAPAFSGRHRLGLAFGTSTLGSCTVRDHAWSLEPF